MEKKFIELQEETLEIEGGYMVGALDDFNFGADFAGNIGALTGNTNQSCTGSSLGSGGY